MEKAKAGFKTIGFDVQADKDSTSQGGEKAFSGLIEDGLKDLKAANRFGDKPEDQEIALLAILKAGGAYLPIDTSYPAPRVQFLLDDAQVPVVISGDRNVKYESVVQVMDKLQRAGVARVGRPGGRFFCRCLACAPHRAKTG